MGNRLSKIYTRTGDDGSTGLGDGTRVSKDSARVAAYGTVDELNSCIGMVIAELSLVGSKVPDSKADPSKPGVIADTLTEIQHELFDLGGELCIPGSEMIADADIGRLEQRLDALNAPLPPLKDFVLPGGSRAAAACHLARTVARRAEREVVTLARHDAVRAEAIRYLNRLSDLLFVIARVLARESGHGEVIWKHERRKRG